MRHEDSRHQLDRRDRGKIRRLAGDHVTASGEPARLAKHTASADGTIAQPVNHDGAARCLQRFTEQWPPGSDAGVCLAVVPARGGALRHGRGQQRPYDGWVGARVGRRARPAAGESGAPTIRVGTIA
ncbi:MAG: hypothetical protein H0W59_02235 [Chloroflexia bacterium]|nr:hypothetical protein [Chloroflexia bacterium]